MSSELIDVSFEDTREADWRVVVSVIRWMAPSPIHTAADLRKRPELDAMPLTYSHAAARSLRIEWIGEGEPRRLVPSWVARLPIARMLDDAQQIARDFELAEYDDLPPLPPGYPVKSNNDEWYRAFDWALSMPHWRAVGGPMAQYREVARRKRVPINRVKQWAHQAKKRRGEAVAPTIVGTCHSCGHRITPGPVGEWEGLPFHPGCPYPVGLRSRDVAKKRIDVRGRLHDLGTSEEG